MARGQAGDQHAYATLLREMTPVLRGIVRRSAGRPADTEDVVQDILLTVHRIRQTYDPTRPFGPWLMAIAHRRVVDRLRREGRISRHEVVMDLTAEDLPAASSQASEPAADYSDLHRAIGTLSAGQRRAVELLKLKELSLKEAAAVSGMSIAALKVAGHRAYKALRAALRPGTD
jgi:RNA polymerase sigma-70 factor (ECF subfamily)